MSRRHFIVREASMELEIREGEYIEVESVDSSVYLGSDGSYWEPAEEPEVELGDVVFMHDFTLGGKNYYEGDSIFEHKEVFEYLNITEEELVEEMSDHISVEEDW